MEVAQAAPQERFVEVPVHQRQEEIVNVVQFAPQELWIAEQPSRHEAIVEGVQFTPQEPGAAPMSKDARLTGRTSHRFRAVGTAQPETYMPERTEDGRAEQEERVEHIPRVTRQM